MADDGYVRSVAKAIVTHLASSQKFDGIQRSSIDVLADLLLRFIGEVGRQSHAFAEISHRKDINPIDVAQALLLAGMTLGDLSKYAENLDEDALIQSIPSFPLRKDLPQSETFDSCKEIPPMHIPSFFPTFPDSHTHKTTSQYPKPKQTAEERQHDLTEQQKGGETAYLKMQARAAPEDAVLQEASGILVEKERDSKEKSKLLGKRIETIENPFLMSPTLEEPLEQKENIETANGLPDLSKLSGGTLWSSNVSSQPAAPGLRFAGWQWGDSIDSAISLTTGGLQSLRQIEDAFSNIPDTGPSEPGGRRRLYQNDARQARVKELVSSRIEEDPMQGFASFEDEEI